jgi:restriction system protein
MGALDRKRRGELLYGVFDVLAEHVDGLQAKHVLAEVERRVGLTDHERGTYPGTDVRRFEKTVRFQTINAVKAGWMVKEKGIWSPTEAGLAAHSEYTDPTRFMKEAERGYRQWAEDQPEAEEPDEPPIDEDPVLEDEEAVGISLTVERAEEMAWQEVRDHLGTMAPFDFQRLVGGLLRGMGYQVIYEASPGKDRGVDLMAQLDPLGSQGPRVKVQVKREQRKTDATTVRAFRSVLRADDVGAFVALGGFTSGAISEARDEAKRVTLIGPVELFELWVEHYERIPDEFRRRLPIKRVPFLAPQDLD